MLEIGCLGSDVLAPVAQIAFQLFPLEAVKARKRQMASAAITVEHSLIQL